MNALWQILGMDSLFLTFFSAPRGGDKDLMLRWREWKGKEIDG